MRLVPCFICRTDTRLARVNRHQGLFYFDASFRPVPLEQHFIGVKGKAGSMASRAALDNACFDKVSELLRAGHQVMVFVHARKDTVKTAQTLREKAAMEGILDLLDPNENERYGSFKRDMGSSRNREMKELSGVGFGCVSFLPPAGLILSGSIMRACCARTGTFRSGCSRPT